MKINEIFRSIQGEGVYAGYPVLFIRLSGCTRNCEYCDTKYHKRNFDMNYETILKTIKNSNSKIVVWTGGEPLLQKDDIYNIIKSTSKIQHHVETNGDLLMSEDMNHERGFSYFNISPKCVKTAKKIKKLVKGCLFYSSIKIPTDLTTNKNLIPYATILMPLTTKSKKINSQIRNKVWNYCVKHNINYSSRLHLEDGIIDK